MHFQINFKSGTPVYRQLMEQIKASVASGLLKEGDPLPSIRPLAEQISVNRNTIIKAYMFLESEGVINTLPGKGSFICVNPPLFSKKERCEKLKAEVDELIVHAYHLKVSKADLEELLDQEYHEFSKTNPEMNE